MADMITKSKFDASQKSAYNVIKSAVSKNYFDCGAGFF
jgi:hypothetical protein